MDKSVYEKIHRLQSEGWWFGISRNKLVIDLLNKYDKKIDNHLILDVGCSEGAFLDFLNKNNLHFNGIDIDENALRLCRERGYENEIRYGSVLDIPFDREHFDIVTLLDIIEHVEDDNKAMMELKRVLKNQGLAVIIVPAHRWLWSPNDLAYHHYRRYSMNDITSLIYKFDYKIEHYSYFNFFLFPAFVIMTYFSKLFKGQAKTSTVLKPMPKPLDYLLQQIMKVEIGLIARLNLKLPIGSSIIFVLRKTE